MKSNQRNIRIKDDEWQRWHLRASAAGMSMTQWIRRACNAVVGLPSESPEHESDPTVIVSVVFHQTFNNVTVTCVGDVSTDQLKSALSLQSAIFSHASQ